MFKSKIKYGIGFLCLCLAIEGCKVPAIVATPPQKPVPASFGTGTDTISMANVQWKQLFTDPYLISLIDTALANNQELLTTLQEIQIAKNDIRFRHASLLPTAAIVAGAGVEKVGRYTSQGAGDATTEIKPGKEFPDPLGDFMVGVTANWEADIWNKLHTAKKAAVTRYLSTMEGKNFVTTNLVAEVANSYFELVALDHQLAIVKKNIGIQQNALDIVKIQKDAARATELGVKKFEAEVLRTRSLEFDIHQQITVTENKINFLLARFPQAVARDTTEFMTQLPAIVQAGVPSQLLENRADVRQAELDLEAAKLDVKVARAEFFPSLGISAGVGFNAFNPTYLLRTPESLLYSLAGELAQPLINRNAIKAEFSSANARQLQALYNYEKTVLNAYMEVANELSNVDNLGKDYDLKLQQVAALNNSIEVALDLFKYARADYFEVLMTQRDVLEAKLELVETRQEQFNAVVNVYRGLGGGWK
ncbi:MAG: TolC family protein [Chitinophagaceae bacterium]|nr:MAG: TolC family protein [Chitinophagaceae bacterium]